MAHLLWGTKASVVSDKLWEPKLILAGYLRNIWLTSADEMWTQLTRCNPQYTQNDVRQSQPIQAPHTPNQPIQKLSYFFSCCVYRISRQDHANKVPHSSTKYLYVHKITILYTHYNYTHHS